MIPSLAARPVPATTATGVASPKAHGQDTTSTLIANCNDSDKEEPMILPKVVSSPVVVTFISR